MFCKYVLLLSSVSISPTMRLEGTRYSETRANLYNLTHRHGLQFHPSKPHISSTSLLRKRGGNETVNLLEAAKSLSLSISLSVSVFSLLVRNERVLIGVINFKGVRVVLLFIRDYTMKLLQNTPYSIVSPRF